MTELDSYVESLNGGFGFMDGVSTRLNSQIGWPPKWRAEIRRSIRGLADLSDDWDSYKAGPVSAQSIEIACRVLDQAIDENPGLQYHLPNKPTVTAAPGFPFSNVQLEWDSADGNRSLDVEFLSNGTLSFGLTDARDPSVCCDGVADHWAEIISVLGESAL